MSAETRLVAVTASGRRLSVSSSGSGRPAVILETGLGAESSDWGRVEDAIATRTLVVRYDRANRAASDPAPKPRTALDSVSDLDALVRELGLPKPIVLVGHSLGGLIVRLYAHQHPRDVLALILVDPFHEDQFERIYPLMSGVWPNILTNLIPPVRRLRKFWKSGWKNPSENSEGADLVANQALGRSIDSLGNIPLIILTSGAFVRSGPPGLGWPKAQRAWVQLHEELLEKSTDSRQIMVPQSDHFIQRTCPEAIVSAIHSVLDSSSRVA